MGRLIDAENAYCVLTVNYNHHTDIQHKALKECLDRIKTEKAITVEWIERYIKACEAFSKIYPADAWKVSAEAVRVMLDAWKGEANEQFKN